MYVENLSVIHFHILFFYRTYLWPHRVSYLYNGVFGLVITIIVGYIASFLVRKICSRPIEDYDPNLFIPPLEKRLRKKRQEQPFHFGHVADFTNSPGDLKETKTESRF